MSGVSQFHEAIDEPDVLVDERPAGVVVVTLNRPRVLNAMRWQMYRDLAEVLHTVECRAMVITGAGRGFCAGDDMHEMFGDGHESFDLGDGYTLDPATKALLEVTYPIVAAVNGPAVGWGLDLAVAADLRVASETARFGALFVRRGQAGTVAGLARLWQLIGREHAAHMLLTGAMVDADTALDWNLVSSVVPEGQALDAAVELAEEIAKLPPLAVAATKAGLARATDPDWRALAGWLGPVHARLFRSSDHLEAVQSHLERRQPTYLGE